MSEAAVPISEDKTKGKTIGSKGWTPVENICLINVATELGITSSEGDKDQKWNSLVSNLKTSMNSEISRVPSATRDHLKDMISFIRSLSSYYSTMAAADKELPRSPTKADFNNPEDFDEEFDLYCTSMWTKFQSLDGDKKSFFKNYTKAWWNLDAVKAVRRFIYDIDNKSSSAADQARTAKHKLDAENEEKAKQMADRRKKEEESTEAQLKAFTSVSGMASTMDKILPQFLTILTTPTSTTTSITDDEAGTKRFNKMEQDIEHNNIKVAKISDDVTDIKQHLEQNDKNVTEIKQHLEQSDKIFIDLHKKFDIIMDKIVNKL